jgi:cytochrome c oxidase subunit 2
MAIASACVPSEPQNWFVVSGDNAAVLKDLTTMILYMAAVVFVLVEGALLYAILRFRRRPANGEALPPQIHGNSRLEIAWTIAPALILIFVAVPTIQTLFHLATPPADRGDPLRVKVIGHQWWWEFQYPDLGVTTANELHIPVGRTVIAELETADVIHSFWVPRLAGKTDLVPNHPNRMWFNGNEPGIYYGQCAEFCGTQHAQMRFRVIVQTASDFQAWVDQQKKPPAAPASDLARQGEELFMGKAACFSCHTVDGTKAQGKVGPNLTHIGGRLTLAAGVLDNTPENLTAWIKGPQTIKPGSKMVVPALTDDEVKALVAYLEGLK